MGGNRPRKKRSLRRQRRRSFSHWDTVRPAPAAHISLEEIGRFGARGMRRIYGRGDRFSGLPALNMDIWRAKSGRVFVRFWSRGSYVDWRAYELHGLVVPVAPSGGAVSDHEALVPAVVRDEYDEWVIDRVEYPYE